MPTNPTHADAIPTGAVGLDAMRPNAMRLVQFQSPNAGHHLACDQALLDLADRGDAGAGECLRVYEVPRPVVVLGIGAKFRDEIHVDACRRAGVPVHRRDSGGGTVLLDAGCLAYAVVLDMAARPELRAVRPSYRWILSRLAEACGRRGCGVEHAGISDLAWRGRKVGGSAQRRRRRFLLHHGTLLYGMDLARLEQFLRPPPREPAYRAGRPHAAFACNLPLGREALVEAVCDAFGVAPPTPDAPPAPLDDGLHDRIRALARERYENDAWNLRR